MFYVCKDSANTIHMYFLYVTFSLHSLFFILLTDVKHTYSICLRQMNITPQRGIKHVKC